MNKPPVVPPPFSLQSEAPRPSASPEVSANDSPLRLVQSRLGIAFVGTYPPRRCGIATFTRDLSNAITSAGNRIQPIALALTDPGGQYEYPENVKYEIRQGVKGDYARAAELVNYSDVRLVSIQHEYGIFGGDDGAYILDFLAALRVPAIVTLHTVLKNPSDSQRTIVQRMAKMSARLVVMSQVAADLLASSYGLRPPLVQMIPHGIPVMAPVDQGALKERFGVAGQKMLITFGLLGPNKGIETVLRALPAVVKRFPELTYFVVGATHPQVARRNGEAYRTTLEREAERLGVRGHVVFRDQFVATDELCAYLQAADVFISPYLNEAQVTSGALPYAMGAGAAVVSTPYWHAQEMLGDGRGRLFPFGDSDALATTLLSLLGTPAELDRVRAASYEFTRAMVWPHVGETYLELARVVMAETPRRPPQRRPALVTSLPELRLDHLQRLTDDTGIIQHATFSVPARRSGYCVDDNARALIVALEADRRNGLTETPRLVTTYLSFLHDAQTEDGQFQNFMGYERRFLRDEPEAQNPSEDCLGRALWALGTTVHLASDEGCRRLALQMFERALPLAGSLGPRGTATTMLGLGSYLAAHPKSELARNALARGAERLTERYHRESTPEWRWFEPTLTYDNALLPLALFKAYAVTGERATLRAARESLEFLEELCFKDGQLRLIGNSSWHGRGAKRAEADEQPTDALAFVLAFRGAYRVTEDRHYLQRMREAFAWFMGANRLSLPLYDFSTNGCHDGLGVTELNRNQGAESTLSFLLALLEMVDVAGDSPEQTSSQEAATN